MTERGRLWMHELPPEGGWAWPQRGLELWYLGGLEVVPLLLRVKRRSCGHAQLGGDPGRPRTHCSDYMYISHLAWECLGIPYKAVEGWRRISGLPFLSHWHCESTEWKILKRQIKGSMKRRRTCDVLCSLTQHLNQYVCLNVTNFSVFRSEFVTYEALLDCEVL